MSVLLHLLLDDTTPAIGGTLIINGVLAGSGLIIGIYNDSLGLVGTTSTAADGSFLYTPPSPGTYFTSYTDGSSLAARSISHTNDGISTFDIVSGSDVTKPTITIMSPAPGTTIGPGTPLVFRYADDTGLRRPMPMAKIKQPDGKFKYELIHDGDNFTADYEGTKTVIQAAPPIWEYTVARKGGWTADIVYSGVKSGDGLQLVPFGTDKAGNELA